ncbi:MAG: hypothetical protein FJ100_24210 [Deltaproteobacteria bacterium]|nr:hypothetical protein [Deltaproteobacteria bacterium]
MTAVHRFAVIAVVAWVAASGEALAQTAADRAPIAEALDGPGDATAAAADRDDVLPFKLSLPTEDDVAAWRGAGFRLELGMAYGRLAGLFGAPSGQVLGATVRVGARVDPWWSLLGSFQYQQVADPGGLFGLRYSGTLDPTLHLGDHLQIAFGVGFAGLVEVGNPRPDPNPSDFTNLADSYTYLSARTPLPQCTGIGIGGLLRAGWQQILGPMSALTAFVELDGQHLACEQRIGRVDPDTARPFFRRQYWYSAGGVAGLNIGWR